jgi:4-amino-4-deoxy-L-arabinose transferase-like glycosyltransferase
MRSIVMKTVERFFPFFLVAGILLNANALLIDILEPDGALYATIAKHIALTGDWFNLFGDGHDWLDKPHFPFWISAASYKLFGITSFAYKLPAFLFWLAGIWFTMKLATALYDQQAAKIAVLVYVFPLHSILNNFDVRAEPYLTSLIVAATYFMYKATTDRNWLYIVAAAFTSACAVMTKGVFTVITIFSGFVIHWVFSGQWKQFINYRYWILAFLIIVFITPELYSLYTQFDLHPEKIVFGRTNVSGLRFFFWDSQFGRFFNTGPIKGQGDPTFFLHTTLWAFLPWSIILYVAVFNLIRHGSTYGRDRPRSIIFGSALLTFLLFSFSRFQLPHYITILFPHFSIITAGYLASIKKERTIKTLTILQTVLLIAAVVAVNILAFYSKIGNNIVTLIISTGVMLTVFILFKQHGLSKLIVTSSGISVVLFLYLLNFFYPGLLKYQAGMVAGKWLSQNNFTGKVATLNAWSYSFEFYAPGFVHYVDHIEQVNGFIGKDSSAAFYTSVATLSQLRQKGFEYSVLQTLPYFHVSMLTATFINPATREGELESMALVLVRKKI